MKDGEMGRLIENYGKKEQKEWLDNTLPDPHPCTAGNKEEERNELSKSRSVSVTVSFSHCFYCLLSV